MEEETVSRSEKAGCGCLGALVGFTVIAALLGAVFGGGDSDSTGSSSSFTTESRSATTTTARSPRTTAEPRERWDNRLTQCTHNVSTGFVEVRGEIANLTLSPQSYYIEVEFVQGDLRIDWSNTIVPSVGPGQRSAWEVFGYNNYDGSFSCRWTVDEL